MRERPGTPSLRASSTRARPFIDSTGPRTVVSPHASASERAQEFAITHEPEQVRSLLGMTRLGEHIRVVDAPEELLP